MIRRKIVGTLFVLFSIQSKYQIESRGFNGGKDSTNAKDLKEIDTRLAEGVGAIKKAGAQIEKMKTEQKGFEKDLGTMLKDHPKAPPTMKKMLDDQKGMQDEVSKSQKDLKQYEDKFGKWIKDIKGLQKKPDDMSTYEALKPFIKEVDAMADILKTITQKFVDQAKRYKDFGQTMIDSSVIDPAVTKRLCSLGTIIEEMGFKVSDIGDPIAMTAERVGDIWQRTNAKDKDTTLSQTSKKLTPKGQAVVTDGDKQATSGKELKKMCEKIGEKGKTLPKDKKEAKGRSDPERDAVDCKKEMGEIVKGLEKLSKEKHELELLRHNLESTHELEEEFEGLTKDIPDPAKIPKELEELADEVGEIMKELTSVRDDVKDMDKCNGTVIEEHGNKITNLYNRILKVAKRWKDLSQKLLSNGQGLVNKYIYTQELKGKYDVVGDRVEHAGNLILGGIAPTIGHMEEHFVKIGKDLGGDFRRSLGGIGIKIKGVVGPLTGHGEKIRDYGIKIKRLKPDAKKEDKKDDEPHKEEDDDDDIHVNDVDISFVLEDTKPEKKEKQGYIDQWGRGWRAKEFDMTKDWTEESVSYEQTHRKTHGVKLYFPVNIWKDSENKMNLLANGPREERVRDDGFGQGRRGDRRKDNERNQEGGHTHGKHREEKLRHEQKHMNHW